MRSHLALFVAFLFAALPAHAQTTWNPSDRNANVTLSGGNLTVAGTSSSLLGQIRSTTGRHSGKIYFEYTVNSVSLDGFAVGFATSVWPLSGLNIEGDSIERMACRNSGAYRRNSPDLTRCVATGNIVAGNIVQVAVDITNNLVWMRRTIDAAGTWNGATADPASGTGGFNLGVGGGLVQLYIMFNGDAFSGVSSVTLNTGGSSFAGTVPSGFTAWGAGESPAPPGQTSWNPADIGIHTVLLDGNFRAQPDLSQVPSAVRATTSYAHGKVYFEMPVFWNGTSTILWWGLANIGQNLNASGNPQIGTGYLTCGALSIPGQATWNQINQGVCITTNPAPTSGDTLYVAVDINNSLIWFSSAFAGGQWNGSTSNNPATGVGGIPLHINTVSGTTCVFPYFYSTFNVNTTAIFYINTGGTVPLRGTVPSGFVSWESGLAGACPPQTGGTIPKTHVWINE